MFDNMPTDTPEEYLSGVAAFVASEGKDRSDMSKQDYIWVLNQIVGLERIPADGDGRASQKVVSAEEAGEDALSQKHYTNTVFEAEAEAWAARLLTDADT